MVRKINEVNNVNKKSTYSKACTQFQGAQYPNYNNFIKNVKSLGYEIYYEDRLDGVIYVTANDTDIALCYKYLKKDSDLIKVYNVGSV